MSAVGRIEVSVAALRHNVAALRSLVRPGCQVAAVVKANAYGHGLEQVVPVLEPLVEAFQVDDLDELRALRKLTDKRALVFGYVPLHEVREAVELGGELSVFDAERLPELARCRSARIHLKIDALLGRLGLTAERLPGFLEELRKYPNLEVVSVYAHYANIEDTTDPSHAIAQESVFEESYRRVREVFPFVGRHFSATSGLMAREAANSANDWVRLGVGLYGLYPSAPLAASFAALELRPALRWVSVLAQVKELPAGHPVGYGLTYRTPRSMKIGIVPQGYADGFDRGFSNSGSVLVQGRRCAVIGRVAMNMFAVDLSNVPDAQAEDEVVLLGRQGDETISAEEVADRIETINYEVVARLNPLLDRCLID